MFLSVAMFLLASLHGQNQPAWMWGDSIQGTSQHGHIEVVCDSQDNYYVVTGEGSTSGKLMKYSIYGELLWSIDLYNSSVSMGVIPRYMAIDSSDNLYLLGLWQTRVMLVKMSTEGNFLWMRYTTITESNGTRLHSLGIDSTGNPVILYYGQLSNPSIPSIYWVGDSQQGQNTRFMKFSPDGNVLINRQIDSLARSVQYGDLKAGLYCSSNGEIYLHGETQAGQFEGFNLGYPQTNTYFVFVCKYDSSLQPQQLTKLYQYTDYGGNVCITGGIIQSDDGSIIVSGGLFNGTWTGGPVSQPGGWFTGKLGNDTLWEWLIPIGGHEIRKDSEGNYLLGFRGGVHKINDNGTLIYTENATLSGQQVHNKDTSIALDSNDDCVIGISNILESIVFDENQVSCNGLAFVGKAGIPRPKLETSPQALNLGISFPGFESSYSPLTLYNRGTGPLAISSFETPAYPGMWAIQGIDMTTPGITIQPGGEQVIMLNFLPTGVQAYADTLCINYNNAADPVKKVRLTAIGEYITPAAVEGVNVEISGYNANLSWLPVTQTIHVTPITPDLYVVLYNETPYEDDLHYYYLTNTPGLEATHYGVARFRDQMFYKVVAVKFYRDQEPNVFDILRNTSKCRSWSEIKGLLLIAR